MKEFAYRASYCDHEQMAALIDFIRALPAAPADPAAPAAADRRAYADPDAGHFAAIFDGLMRNRGFGPKELPFMGLSLSTILHSMLTRDSRNEHRWYQLSNVAGPLGWRFEDLTAVAHEPPPRTDPATRCTATTSARCTSQRSIKPPGNSSRSPSRPIGSASAETRAPGGPSPTASPSNAPTSPHWPDRPEPTRTQQRRRACANSRENSSATPQRN